MAAVIVHGGAYTVPDSVAGAYLKGCRLAAEEAYKLLESGSSALDAGNKIMVTKPSYNCDSLQLRQL